MENNPATRTANLTLSPPSGRCSPPLCICTKRKRKRERQTGGEGEGEGVNEVNNSLETNLELYI